MLWRERITDWDVEFQLVTSPVLQEGESKKKKKSTIKKVLTLTTNLIHKQFAFLIGASPTQTSCAFAIHNYMCIVIMVHPSPMQHRYNMYVLYSIVIYYYSTTTSRGHMKEAIACHMFDLESDIQHFPFVSIVCSSHYEFYKINEQSLSVSEPAI